METSSKSNYHKLSSDTEEEEENHQELIVRESKENGERKNTEEKVDREIKECRICLESELDSDEPLNLPSNHSYEGLSGVTANTKLCDGQEILIN